MVLPTVEEVEYAITNKLGTLLGGIKKRRRTRKRKRRKTKRKRKNKLSKTQKLNI